MTHWSNSRPRRLLTWALRLKSPSIGRVPTFLEAWTGMVERTVWDDVGERVAREQVALLDDIVAAAKDAERNG